MELIISNWNKTTYQEFLQHLNNNQDIEYLKFQNRLIPNNNIIGVRTPLLKKMAKEINKGNYDEFINLNNHTYYEENTIHAFIISNLKLPIDELITYIDNFLPYINNWATCDLFCSSLHCIKNNKDIFFNYINKKIKSKNPWIRRFCFVIMLNYFIDEKYLPKIFHLCDKYNTKDYYVNMAVAWLLSIAYINYKEATLKYINNNQLDKFTHNKAIQKIIESTRINKEEKIH